MNIEEERKAFDQWTGLDSKLSTHEFVFWLKAKAHAEEMSKPDVYVKEGLGRARFYSWLLVRASGEYRGYHVESFKTAEDAEQWAKDNGYRVVSE